MGKIITVVMLIICLVLKMHVAIVVKRRGKITYEHFCALMKSEVTSMILSLAAVVSLVVGIALSIQAKDISRIHTFAFFSLDALLAENIWKYIQYSMIEFKSRHRHMLEEKSEEDRQ